MKPLYSTTVPLSVFCGSVRAICDNFLCTPVHTTVEMLSPPNCFLLQKTYYFEDENLHLVVLVRSHSFLCFHWCQENYQ